MKTYQEYRLAVETLAESVWHEALEMHDNCITSAQDEAQELAYSFVFESEYASYYHYGSVILEWASEPEHGVNELGADAFSLEKGLQPMLLDLSTWALLNDVQIELNELMGDAE